MKTLEDFRNDYAKEKHYDNWNDFFYRATAKAIEKGSDIAAERFANAKAKALLEEAAEKARLKMLEDQKPTPYEMEDFIKSLIPKEQ